MTDPYDRASWERRWAEALEQHGERIAERPPNPHLVAELADLPPGRALDAGCGHGAEAIWLAQAGWRVTAVDFSSTALEQARRSAESAGAVIEWVEGDLGDWTPPDQQFDLVSCIYVHVAGSVGEMITRLAAGVAPGGMLFLVGRQNTGQAQVTLTDALAVLRPPAWQVLVAQDRGADAVIRATHA